MERMAFVLLASLLFGACANRSLEQGSDTPVLESADVCLMDGDFDFVLTAEALSPWEGKRARAVALEPSQEGPARRPADVRGMVHEGRFVAACPRALRPNSWYPSAAVFIDVDGDGRCGPGDVGLTLQFYGWSAEFAQRGFSLPEAGVNEPWAAIASGGGHADSIGPGFCSTYFD